MMSNQRPDFGPRLRELREKAGLTQADLAEKAGLHRQGIVKLERGEREPAWSTLLALADALGVPVQAFAEAGDAPAPPPAEPTPRPKGRPRKAAPPSPPVETPPTKRKAGGAKGAGEAKGRKRKEG